MECLYKSLICYSFDRMVVGKSFRVIYSVNPVKVWSGGMVSNADSLIFLIAVGTDMLLHATVSYN